MSLSKLQTNALRIAELMGWRYNPIFKQNTLDCNEYFTNAVKINSNDELIDLFSSYIGLMPIVFESNNTDCEIHLYSSCVQLNTDDIQIFDYNTEPGFIEALQLACIKYLELKND